MTTLTVGLMLIAFSGGMMVRHWLDVWNEAILMNDLIEHGYMTDEAMEKFVMYRGKKS